jgi:hypothetical protein
VRDPDPAAKPGDRFRFRDAFRAQAVVDRGRADPSRKGGMSEQKQGEAVGPARDGDGDPAGIGPRHRLEIEAETRN